MWQRNEFEFRLGEVGETVGIGGGAVGLVVVGGLKAGRVEIIGRAGRGRDEGTGRFGWRRLRLSGSSHLSGD